MSAEDSAPFAALLDTPTKSTFNAQSFGSLIETINGAPALLDGDWRQLILAQFELSTRQAESLHRVAPGRVDEIQRYLQAAAAHIRQGGTIAGHIVKLPIEERTPEAVHEVRIEQIPSRTATAHEIPTPRMLRVAHCDADCRNWRWNSL